MSEAETQDETEAEVPTVADVPEPDQEPTEDEAEAEAEAERQAEPEPEVESEAQGATQAEWEARFNKSEKRFATYTRQVSDIYGDDAVNLIPVSISPSAPPGFIYKYDAGNVPDEVKAPILEFFGIAREQDYEPDPETVACSDCKGKGKTKTGSTVGNHETRPCPTCKGYGYTTKAGAVPVAISGTNGQNITADFNVTPLVTEDVDNWGEPKILPDGRLNPNYGKQPQFKEQVAPWGVTANLTAQDAKV
jgi:hypothetical protein